MEVKTKKKRPDPPFFKLELLDGEKSIYIIGSIHFAHHNFVLNDFAFKFLIGDKLLGSTDTAVFIEHELSNTMLLGIRKGKRLSNFWKERFKEWIGSKGIEFPSSLVALANLEDDPLILRLNARTAMFTMENLFRYKIKDIFKEDPWVAESILKSQLGLKLYQKDGGFEYDILHHFDTRKFHFLETVEDYYNVLKTNSKKEEDIFDGINDMLIELFALPDERFPPELRDQMYDFSKLDSNDDLDPITVILRNHLWVKNLITKRKLGEVLETKKNILIIVGLDHLKGDQSLLKLLMPKLKSILKAKYRYSYEINNWIPWV